MLNEYEIRIEKLIAHPDGHDYVSPQFRMNVKLDDRGVAKLAAAIANELNYIAEMSGE